MLILQEENDPTIKKLRVTMTFPVFRPVDSLKPDNNSVKKNEWHKIFK